MRKIALSIVLTISAIAVFGQAVPDASFTDCNGTTKSIYQALAMGKVLFVANAGTDCGICQSHAPNVAALANSNPSSIEVWGAITTKTGGNPGCTSLNSWVSTYGWTNVFSFLDANKYWFVAGTPRYTVIDPSDSSIAYAGSNYTTAENTATQLATAFSVNENNLVNEIVLLPTSIRVSFSSTNSPIEVTLYNVTGARLQQWSIPRGAATVELPLSNSYHKGLYILRMNIGGKQVVEKIML